MWNFDVKIELFIWKFCGHLVIQQQNEYGYFNCFDNIELEK